MKNAISLVVASVLGVSLLAGCSSEVKNPNHAHSCPTDFIATFGQEVYFGKYQWCFTDGHSVPVSLPQRATYYDQTTTTTTTVSGNSGGTVSASASVQAR